MARIIFTEDNHEYQVDGEIKPCVSDILRFVAREVYGDVMQSTLDHAADRGRQVHKSCELLDKYGRVECEEEIVPYVLAYKQFLQDYSPVWSLIEHAMYNKEYDYAGTIDRFGTVVPGRTALVDIKSSYAVQRVSATAQLAGYAKTLPEPPDDLFILHLKPDGTYNLMLMDNDDSVFIACLILHRAMEKKPSRKPRKKKEDPANE